jgi:hypothetical protein
VYEFALTADGRDSSADLIDLGQISALSHHAPADAHAETRAAVKSVIKVRTRDFSSFIASLGPVDYFSLDVEGMEMPLLQCFRNCEFFRPGLITVEHGWKAIRSEISSLMGAAGYIRCFPTAGWLTRGDDWFLRADHFAELSSAKPL